MWEARPHSSSWLSRESDLKLLVALGVAAALEAPDMDIDVASLFTPMRLAAGRSL